MNDIAEDEPAPPDTRANNKPSWWTAERRASHSELLKIAMERSRREAGAPKPGTTKPQRVAGQPDAKSRAAHAALVAGIWEIVKANPVRAMHLPEIGRQIRRHRAPQMSVLELADAIGLTEGEVMGIESGSGLCLTPEIVARICEELSVPPTFILTNVARRGTVDV